MSKTILPMMIAALLFTGASLPLQNASAHFCIEVVGVASFEAPTYAPPYVPGNGCGVDDCGDGNFHDHTVVPGNPPEPPPELTQPVPTQEEINASVAWALSLDRAAFDGCYGDKEAPGNCVPQPVHSYGSGSSIGAESVTAQQAEGVGLVTVFHTTSFDCNGDGVPGGWDGDYEQGIGGGFFGWGPWADEPVCNYDLNAHGGRVTVDDDVFENIAFVIGEDDQAGPVIIRDPTTNEVIDCETDGSISEADLDDCLSEVFVNEGSTCGPGGGDGGFWVFLQGFQVTENGGVSTNSPPTTGDIIASN